jgi:hypothetical protein
VANVEPLEVEAVLLSILVLLDLNPHVGLPPSGLTGRAPCSSDPGVVQQ